MLNHMNLIIVSDTHIMYNDPYLNLRFGFRPFKLKFERTKMHTTLGTAEVARQMATTLYDYNSEKFSFADFHRACSFY